MTCKQLAGPYDKEFHAETFDELVEMSKKHGMEMAEKGDGKHIKVMEEMKAGMKEFVEKIQIKFNALPEDK